MEELIPLVTIVSLFVILPGMAMWFADRRRRARGQDDEVSQTRNADLLRLAERMERRIDSLERILDAEAPGWRNRHHG